jgi:hypothetical protein
MDTLPDNTYHRHNQDKHSAHVADQPLPHDTRVLDTIWVNTFKKTEKVLGRKPNIFFLELELHLLFQQIVGVKKLKQMLL